MFRVLSICLRTGSLGPRIIIQRPSYRFSSMVADPFYILGVEKNAQFSDVKKAFYKLANEYHPDKNTSPIVIVIVMQVHTRPQDAEKQFIIIKQAFEQIKVMKGLSIAQPLEKSKSKYANASVRPNPEDFEDDEAETNRKSETDYRMQAEKSPQGEEYDNLRKSFTTIHDMNDIKIRVEEGTMRDTTCKKYR